MYFLRHIAQWALSPEHLYSRMCFIAGPRQVGKTTMLQHFLKQQGQSNLYYNWDTPSVKKRYALNPIFFIEDVPAHFSKPWVVLDEIHKYPKWKNILKGYYDEWKNKVNFIVTGSAKLDLMRRSGDSLVGRYFLFHMLPLGPREIMTASPGATDWIPGQPLASVPLAPAGMSEAIKQLIALTGFPEPFSVGTDEFCTRWRENYISLLLREDLRDLTKIDQIRKLETLLYLLPEKVGSSLSLNALCLPLECAYGSVRSWLQALELIYLIFAIPPWTVKFSRGIRKEKKYYFWDWGMVVDPGGRFENFLAVQLQRAIASYNELGKGTFSLYYVRSRDGQEVDFVVADRTKVRLLIEAKTGEIILSKSLLYFQGKFKADLAVQVVNKNGLCIQKGKDLYIMGIDRFLSLLP